MNTPIERKSKSSTGILVMVVLFSLLILVGSYLVYDWASDQTPWFRRIVFVVLASWFGWKLGVAVSGERAKRRGTNWTAVGGLVLGLAISFVFFVWRPVSRERERDEAFIAIRDDLRSSTESLTALSMEEPAEADRIQYLTRLSAYGRLGVDRMKNADKELPRFTPEQREELIELTKALTQAIRAAKSKLPEAKPKDDEGKGKA